MPTSRASGNQIEETTNALLSQLTFATQNSVLKFPIGTESQRPANPAVGMLRFNTTNDRPEQYMNVASNNQPGWKEIKGGGGGAGLGDYQLIRGNARTIEEDLIIPSNSEVNYGFEYAFTIGPEITISSPYTLTIPDGTTYTIVDTGDEPNTLDIGSGAGSIIGPQWTNIGSGDGLGTYQLIRGNPRTISENLTIPAVSTTTSITAQTGWYDSSTPALYSGSFYTVGTGFTTAAGTGSGSGAIIDVTSIGTYQDGGILTINVTNGGSGYAVGDRVIINHKYPGAIMSFEYVSGQGANGNRTAGTYGPFTIQSSWTAANGVGGTPQVVVGSDGSISSLNLAQGAELAAGPDNNAGWNYVEDEEVTIPGNLIGGSTPADDLVMKTAMVTGDGDRGQIKVTAIGVDASLNNYAFEDSYSVGPDITISSGYTVTVSDGVTYQIL